MKRTSKEYIVNRIAFIEKELSALRAFDRDIKSTKFLERENPDRDGFLWGLAMTRIGILEKMLSKWQQKLLLMSK